MKPFKSIQVNKSTIQIVLLCMLLFLIFVIPIFPQNWLKTLFRIANSMIFFTCILALNKYREKILPVAALAFVIMWVSELLNMFVLKILSNSVVILFFIIIVARLLIQIASSKKVDAVLILESISGYLLIGVLFSFLFALVIIKMPASVAFPGTNDPTMADIIYFTFVTMTTLGYGDVLPALPLGRSLAILVSVTGQIYLTVIIAMLVGKYVSTK